ncbi:MAG: NAD(P)-binding domain-containing protein [Gammaproteobacteria bacterium]|nr:NAD(P)-binding domain-containing protein [Gammaproteobacteria bacterium]
MRKIGQLYRFCGPQARLWGPFWSPKIWGVRPFSAVGWGHSYTAPLSVNKVNSSVVGKNLRDILKHSSKQSGQCFENTLLVGVQHVLGTTVDMFEVLREHGLTNAVIGGKSYSTHEPSAKKLEAMGYHYVPHVEQLGYGFYESANALALRDIWLKALDMMHTWKPDLLIILDDGGQLLDATPATLFNGMPNKPKEVIGIEQTKGGVNRPHFNSLPFRIINVSDSLVKSIEYPSVADVVASRAVTTVEKQTQTPANELTVGVVGFGRQGKAIAEKFLQRGYQVIVHDQDQSVYQEKDERIDIYPSVVALINNADVIVGCTGKDITESNEALNAFLYSAGKKKWLVSASSEDREFKKLLAHVQIQTRKVNQTPDPFNDIVLPTRRNGEIEILRGGFPVNFTNEEHSVCPEKIWPTRAALISACFMANEFYYDKKVDTSSAYIYMLCEYKQLQIIKKFMQLNPNDPFSKRITAYLESSCQNFGNSVESNELLIDYIRRHSRGETIHQNKHLVFNSSCTPDKGDQKQAQNFHQLSPI